MENETLDEVAVTAPMGVPVLQVTARIKHEVERSTAGKYRLAIVVEETFDPRDPTALEGIRKRLIAANELVIAQVRDLEERIAGGDGDV